MPDAHAAAVEAMAGAACLRAQTYTEGGPFMKRDGSWSESWTDVGCAGPGKKQHPECIIAALVRSEAVRAALMEAEGRQPCVVNPYEGSERSGDPGFVYCCGLAHPACVLAALAPPEATFTTPNADSVRPDLDLAYWAWTIIANAHGGNWDEATEEWRDAATRWRDSFHAALNAGRRCSDGSLVHDFKGQTTCPGCGWGGLRPAHSDGSRATE